MIPYDFIGYQRIFLHVDIQNSFVNTKSLLYCCLAMTQSQNNFQNQCQVLITLYCDCRKKEFIQPMLFFTKDSKFIIIFLYIISEKKSLNSMRLLSQDVPVKIFKFNSLLRRFLTLMCKFLEGSETILVGSNTFTLHIRADPTGKCSKILLTVTCTNS